MSYEHYLENSKNFKSVGLLTRSEFVDWQTQNTVAPACCTICYEPGHDCGFRGNCSCHNYAKILHGENAKMSLSNQRIGRPHVLKVTRVKPYPQPGDVWEYAGKPVFEGTVVGTRVFHGETQVIFNDGSVAGAYHMMGNDAWQYMRTVDLMPHYREIFKTAYTKSVMRGSTIPDGIFAGAQAVRQCIGNDDRAAKVMQTLRARLGDVLGPNT